MAKLQFLRDEGTLEQMWNLSYYKKGCPTYMTPSSFHFFSKKGDKEVTVSKEGEISSIKNFNVK